MVYDHGTLVSLALRLSKDFEQVDYFYPESKSDYSKTSELCIGDGFEEINWVEHFWDAIKKNKYDLVIFTGVRDGDIQDQLIEKGIPVWGSREAECMEVYRWDFLEFQKKLGMDTPKSMLVHGMTELRNELHKRKEKCWVKLDANERGNIETFPYIDEEATEISVLRPLEAKLSSAAEIVPFIIQDSIKSVREDGGDHLTVDGKFSDITTYGIEAKGEGWIGKVISYSDLPDGLKTINALLAPALKEYEYRGNLSTEIKESTDGKSYLIDLTCRHPNPPTNCIMDNWVNIAECMVEAAKGNLVTPIFEEGWMCEIFLFSSYARFADYKLLVPEELEPYVKRPYCYKSKVTGSIITVPQSSYLPTDEVLVGTVVARAKSKEEVLKLCIERAHQIEGHGIIFNEHCLDEAAKNLV